MFSQIKWIMTLLFIPLISVASPATWNIIPSQSDLTFTATQNNAPVTGEFKHFKGDIAFDFKDLVNSHISITVDISSLSASYADLVKTLLTPDWFNAQNFPKAEFKSSTIKHLDGDRYMAQGELTIRDKTVPVNLTFIARPTKKGTKMAAVGSATINRNQFGVGQGEWASTEEVANKVIVHFKINAVKES